MYPVLFLMGLWVRKREKEAEEKREKEKIVPEAFESVPPKNGH